MSRESLVERLPQVGDRDVVLKIDELILSAERFAEARQKREGLGGPSPEPAAASPASPVAPAERAAAAPARCPSASTASSDNDAAAAPQTVRPSGCEAAVNPCRPLT